MNWYIGQDIVCISSNCDLLIVGNTYSILSLKKSPCKCGGCDIDVGNRMENIGTECECGYIDRHGTDTCWYHESQFKPLDELADISELTEVLEAELFEPKVQRGA